MESIKEHTEIKDIDFNNCSTIILIAIHLKTGVQNARSLSGDQITNGYFYV
jgi:hypothetical protein